jgi:hypothetical protein
MAKMIPAQFDGSTASAAERKIFELLKSDPDTSDWIVLHSLGLARRGTKPYGEIDFVVLIPAAGVFCLEVKGGRIACHGGEWETTNRYDQTEKLKRSPFLQAREGMFALRESLQNKMSGTLASELVYGYAVVMPDISFTAQSQEWEQSQVIDRDALKQPVSAAIRRLASSQRKFHPKSPAGEPMRQTVRTIQQMLRPDFEFVVTRGVQIDDTEARLLRLTEEQFDALDLLEDNERCLFEGAAGTGKTMLALEYARRSAVAGKRTLFICYNRLLGDWLRQQTETLGLRQYLAAGRYFKLLRELITHSSISSDFMEQEKRGQTSELYDTTYALCGQMAAEEVNQPYDVLVMDEAQDLLKPGTLQVLNSWLKNGLANGCWAVFGDFQRQAIFGDTSGEDLKVLLKQQAPQFVKGKLTLNCRNSRNIGEETALLSGFSSPPYRMGQVSGLPVDYRYYTSRESQQAALTEALKRLLTEGVKPSDIAVLSRLRLENSGLAGLNGEDHFRLFDADGSLVTKSRVPVIRFSTVQAFKGMESPVVVLCDIEQVTDGEPQSLLYVAMSRARSHLTVLVHQNARPFIGECVRRKLEEQWSRNS